MEEDRPHAHHSSAFLMRPDGTLEWAVQGSLRRPVLLLTRARLCSPPVQRRPIHPVNALTTHLAAVCRKTNQSCPTVSARNDSVDQTVARLVMRQEAPAMITFGLLGPPPGLVIWETMALL
ncbi:hypothetical protein NQZ68_014771 [Dissostichus eleginoides]|nr:hypothetical protein NQZ68_014771 [Dissostichus eleginoides]